MGRRTLMTKTLEVLWYITFDQIVYFLFSREKFSDAEHGGEECAKTRLLELAETLPCTVVCKSPGEVKESL